MAIVKSIIIFTLVSSFVAVASAAGASTIVGTDYRGPEAGIRNLNEFLVTKLPENQDVEKNVDLIKIKSEDGFGFFETDLKTAVNQFLVLVNANKCSLDVIYAAGYFLSEAEKTTRVNVVLKPFWDNKLREECKQSYDSLVKEYLNTLPKTEQMNKFLKGIAMTAKSDENHYYYSGTRYIADDLARLAKEANIVLVHKGPNEVDGKVTSTNDDRAYNHLVNNYFVPQCIAIYKGSKYFQRVVRDYQANGKDNIYKSMSPDLENIAYRLLSCERHDKEARNFMSNIKKYIFEEYKKMYVH